MKEAFTIIKSENPEKKDRWVRIGIAFNNKDGSMNCFLDALPVNGKIHIREKKEVQPQPQQQELPMPEPEEAPF